MVNDRVNRLIKVLDMNISGFSQSVSVNVTVIFNIIRGRRSKPSYDLILKILKTYNKLNTDWLIRGRGSMWNDDIVTSERIVPSYVNVQDRIKELMRRVRIDRSESYELSELEELVLFVMEESSEQKNRLIVMNEQKEGVIKILKKRLKLRKK